MGTRLGAADNLALAAGAVFVEIYDADIDNPSNATTITTLYGRLP